jgi:small subunit ribosomal protein S17
MSTEMAKKQKEEIGVVRSAKMDKTVIVEVTRTMRHAKYGKVIKLRKKYYAHNELESVNKGDTVRIFETRPLSKLKRWRVIEVVNKAEVDDVELVEV